VGLIKEEHNPATAFVLCEQHIMEIAYHSGGIIWSSIEAKFPTDHPQYFWKRELWVKDIHRPHVLRLRLGEIGV
jgi:hypothetical protein